MKHSNELQGLRAIAVLLVLGFHAGWIPGGYIGVDVFYVISGYLITSLIIRTKDFSFIDFYNRRAKRLLPAAYLVLAVTAIAFWFMAPVISRAQFGKDLLASTWYLSNYAYAHWQNDYQNLGAAPSPLIHFWSLAVEEQFYLFWPLAIFLGRKRLKATVISITVLSFAFSLYAVNRAPIFAFYSLPTRAFELGVGAIVSLYSFKLKILWPGIAAIFIGALLFDNHTVFPALPALLPTLGAAAIITSLKPNRLLGNVISRGIGDWSYSIYLWHWPFLILPTLYLQRSLNNPEKTLALLLCIALSAITFKFVENPIRHKKWSGKRTAMTVLVSGAILSLSSGLLIANSASALDLKSIRMQPQIYADGCQLDKQASKPDPKCIYGEKSAMRSVVLFGDSHAAQWFPAVEAWAKNRKYKLVVMTKSSCPALALPLKDNGAFKASICNEFRKNALIEIAKLNPDLVVIGNFEHYDGVSTRVYLQSENFKFKYLLIRDTAWPNRDIPTCLTTKKNCDTVRPVEIPYRSKNIFDPIALTCTLKNCPAKVDGLVAYRDQTHITVTLAEHLASKLGEKIDSLVAR